MTELTFRGRVRPRGDASILGDWWHTVDRWTFGAVLLLFAVGLVLGLAASPPLAHKNDLWTYHYVVRHVVFAVIAIGVIVAVSMLPLRVIRRLGVLLALGTVVAIALLPWLGTDHGKGAVRWFSVGGISLQPAEFLKPGFVLICAWLIAGAMERGGPPGRTLSAVLMLTVAGMLALQPDFGQAMLIVAVWGTMIFVSGTPVLVLLGLAGGVGAVGAFAYFNSSHVASRINGYMADEVDPRTQLAYAETAIREGGLFGVGAAQGSVKWTLPDAHTDFIIAVAAEEFGLVMTLFIIGLFLVICGRSLARLTEERDVFTRLGGTGLAVIFGLQAFVNMSVAIRLLPAKGMTLPFVSYGGSSMIAAAIGIGALLAMTRTRPQDAAAALRSGV